MFIVQVDTLKCPQKGASVVPWDSLSPADQIFFGGGWVCKDLLPLRRVTLPPVWGACLDAPANDKGCFPPLSGADPEQG
jgi:hypothetical protein